MKIGLIVLVLCGVFEVSFQIAIRNEKRQDNIQHSKMDLINRDHIRRKRYLGLGRKFKLNKRYQECIAPGDIKGHCKHLAYCNTNIFNAGNTLESLCVIEKTFVGICCPDDILSAGVSGSQIVVDLPAGGYDYEDNENATGCGIPAEGRSVLKRSNGKIQEWPWIAALYRPKNLEKGLEQQFCGGALITDNHVLTAAHCVHDLDASEISVRLGEYNFKTNHETRSRDYAVAEIISHEEFVLATYANDIAIVRLQKPTSFNTYIWPICLPPRKREYENTTVIVAGWGQQYFAGPVSEVLLQVEIPVWPVQNCVDAFVQRITDDNICAAGFDGGKDSCLGDSGGPLMYQLENNRWVTIGVVSWGIGCGNKNQPGIYTKVSNYIPWIVKNTMVKQ